LLGGREASPAGAPPRFGLPDRRRVRGSRRGDPTATRCRSWEHHCNPLPASMWGSSPITALRLSVRARNSWTGDGMRFMTPLSEPRATPRDLSSADCEHGPSAGSCRHSLKVFMTGCRAERHRCTTRTCWRASTRRQGGAGAAAVLGLLDYASSVSNHVPPQTCLGGACLRELCE